MVKSVFSHCFFFSFLALQHVIADMRTKYAEGFFYTHKPSYVCKDCGLPLPRYSGLLDAFSNLLITVTGSSHVAVQYAVSSRCF